MGAWIWETNTLDKQTVRFWKAFEISAGRKMARATIRITVDNGYTLFLDGEEIGRGSDWRTVTEFDVTQLLWPGRHVVAVEGFNDRLAGGMIFALQIQFADGTESDVVSDSSWNITTVKAQNWARKNLRAAHCHPAIIVGQIRMVPWENWPMGLAALPPLKPLLVHFWQRVWFQLALLSVSVTAVIACLWLLAQLAAQTRAQSVLHVERVRIARDIHDELGAQLTQLLLSGEVAQREHPEDSAAQKQFTQICDQARQLAQSMDEVVWAVNARRDTVRDFTSYVCKYAQLFLGPTGIRCRLDVEPEIPEAAFDLPVRRNLFLAVKEALNNAAKHSQANELYLRINRNGKYLQVSVEDNGRGFDANESQGERNGFGNMTERMSEMGGTCEVWSQPGGGCRVTFTVPLPDARRRLFARGTE